MILVNDSRPLLSSRELRRRHAPPDNTVSVLTGQALNAGDGFVLLKMVVPVNAEISFETESSDREQVGVQMGVMTLPPLKGLLSRVVYSIRKLSTSFPVTRSRRPQCPHR